MPRKRHYVLKTMQEPCRGSQLGHRLAETECLEEEL